jgi:hypothetical protein
MPSRNGICSISCFVARCDDGEDKGDSDESVLEAIISRIFDWRAANFVARQSAWQRATTRRQGSPSAFKSLGSAERPLTPSLAVIKTKTDHSLTLHNIKASLDETWLISRLPKSLGSPSMATSKQ